MPAMYYRFKFLAVISILFYGIFFIVSVSGQEAPSERELDKFINNMSPNEKWLTGVSLPVNISPPWPPLNEGSLEVGKIIYRTQCAVCHGVKGDGNGERAADLKIKPRDFRFAVYKFRSTPTGAAPTDEDLFKTISRGLHGTAMVPWLGLNNSQKWLVIYYIKSLSDFFDEAEEHAVVTPPAPSKTPEEYVKLGVKVYEKAKCFECHGKDGLGDGIKEGKLKDDWGLSIASTNFRKRILKRGLNINEIYLTIATGLNGTPMPSYRLALNDEEILALSYFIQSMAPSKMTRVTLSRRYPAPDSMLGLRLDHMQGVRFPGLPSFSGR